MSTEAPEHPSTRLRLAGYGGQARAREHYRLSIPPDQILDRFGGGGVRPHLQRRGGVGGVREFALEEDNPEELTKRMQKQWIVKKASQPMSHQSAGCIFKNPRGMHAGMLIEQAGLKGTQVGAAEVSQQHANFIIAHPGASSNDVLRLIDLVRGRVAERLGIELETEIEIW